MFVTNDFYNVIRYIDPIAHIKIGTLYEKNMNKEPEYEFEGYIDDIPFKYIDFYKYRLLTEEEIRLMPNYEPLNPITIEHYTNQFGVVIPYLDVTLVEKIDKNDQRNLSSKEEPF